MGQGEGSFRAGIPVERKQMQEGQVVPVSCAGRERAIALLAFLACLACSFVLGYCLVNYCEIFYSRKKSFFLPAS
jgi:hypothetical protein